MTAQPSVAMTTFTEQLAAMDRRFEAEAKAACRAGYAEQMAAARLYEVVDAAVAAYSRVARVCDEASEARRLALR